MAQMQTSDDTGPKEKPLQKKRLLSYMCAHNQPPISQASR